MKKICGIATLPGTIKAFMLDNLQYVAEHGYVSFVVSSPETEVASGNWGDVTFIPIKEMKWGLMTPWAFYKCVWRLYKIFKKEKFDIIQYATSNAALCASIAGWLARVPVRINCQWGISYPIYKGWKRKLFYYSHKLTCQLSTSVQPDSKGNLIFSLENGLYPKYKGMVVFNGSACGLNLAKYDINKRGEWRNVMFQKYDLGKYKRIFGFVGRVTVEKGINELLEAFMNLNCWDACLMIVGPLDDVGRLNQTLFEEAKKRKNIIIVGPVQNTAGYYAALDFMLLPSYQEGFGMTVLEAAGVGTPSIITNIKGPTELVKDGVNGFVCEVKNVSSLQEVLQKAYDISESDLIDMSESAHAIAARDFDSKVFKQLFLENRDELLKRSLQNKTL